MALGILGLGVSGLAALKLALKNQEQVYAINQGEPESWECYSELESLMNTQHMLAQKEELEVELDELIISPGVDPRIPFISKLRSKGVKIISEIEYASRFIEIPIIGITGTNGKTTTCTLLALALEMLGKKTFLGGNIGNALSLLPLSSEEFDYAVVELSSFQLEAIETFRPKVACILNISKSHSERYENSIEYAQAKFNIIKNLQNTDVFIYPQNCFGLDEKVFNHYCHKVEVTQEMIMATQTLLDFSQMKVVGEHYPEMFTFLRLILEKLNLFSTEALEEIIKNFTGLEHRIEFVKDDGKRVFYNDSKSTNLASTVNAIRSFKGPVHLIMGGQLRENDISDFERLINIQERISSLFLFGESSDLIMQNFPHAFRYKKIEQFVDAFEDVTEGVLLYSPGFPSFDMFKNYKERGKSFKNAVLKV